jgi:hypothetical protein
MSHQTVAMNRRWKCLGFLLLVTALLGGCVSAQPVLRLSPRGDDAVWVGGTAVVSKTGVKLRVATAFARDYDGRVGFRVEVENRSAQPLVVDSNVFSFATCTRPERRQPEVCTPARLAINPEKVLLDMDIARSREQALNANEATFHAVMFLLDATASIASATSGKGHNAVAAADLANHEGRMLDQTQARESRQVSAYELERANWTTAAFRKTTIFPGKAAAGLVFTERDVNAQAVWLLVRIGGETFSFPFDQTVYIPRPDYVVEKR